MAWSAIQFEGKFSPSKLNEGNDAYISHLIGFSKHLNIFMLILKLMFVILSWFTFFIVACLESKPFQIQIHSNLLRRFSFWMNHKRANRSIQYHRRDGMELILRLRYNELPQWRFLFFVEFFSFLLFTPSILNKLFLVSKLLRNNYKFEWQTCAVSSCVQ